MRTRGETDADGDSGGGCGGIAILLGVGLLVSAVLGLGFLLIATNPDRWQPIADPNEHPLSFARDARRPETLYLGTEQGHILRSQDGGRRWVEHHRGLPSAPISALALLPDGTRLVAGATGGVFVSSDGGETWRGEGDGLPPDAIVDALAVRPDGAQLAGTTSDGVYLLQSGAADWAPVASGLPTHADVYTLLVSPQSGQAPVRILAGLVAGGVYASQDGGAHWAPSADGLGAADQLDVFTLLAEPPPRAAVAPTILAGTSRGVYLSRDTGATWTASSFGIGATRALSLAQDPLDPIDVFAGTDLGVSESRNGGAAWRPVGYGLPADLHVGLVAVAHVAGSDRVVLASADQLYRFPDVELFSTQPWRALAVFALVAAALALVWIVAWLLHALAPGERRG